MTDYSIAKLFTDEFLFRFTSVNTIGLSKADLSFFEDPLRGLFIVIALKFSIDDYNSVFLKISECFPSLWGSSGFNILSKILCGGF